MFKWFKKKEEKKYLVVCSCLSLCKGVEVAWFTSKEAAQEYCDFKNSTREDDDFEWGLCGEW
jgi:hypothetical protein